jgi:uncharacterized protein YgiM (DUF1202 family)
MADFEKIKDENLENVTGGRRRYIENDSAGYANIRSGPGTNYDVAYSLNNGQSVYTTGYTVYSDRDGYRWAELDDGNFIALHLLGD